MQYTTYVGTKNSPKTPISPHLPITSLRTVGHPPNVSVKHFTFRNSMVATLPECAIPPPPPLPLLPLPPSPPPPPPPPFSLIANPP